MTDEYEVNEADIEKTIRYLKLTDTENATRENAIAKLEGLKANLHQLSQTEPEKLPGIKKKIDDDSKRWEEFEKYLKGNEV